MHPVLRTVEHRPYPLPNAPWVMTQTWHDLLFAHWPVSPAVVRPLVPAQLPLDTWDGSAWVAVTPFWMSRVRPSGLPSLPGLSRFAEINVRTYVRLEDKPGVFFFSLDAENLSAVLGARALFGLPYFWAAMSVKLTAEDIFYSSRRRRANPGGAEFRGRYRPCSPVQLPIAGTLEHFLTERYCLYTVRRRRVYRADIHHAPWPLQQAEADFHRNTMAAAAGILLSPTQPVLHFARELKVFIWPIQRVNFDQRRAGR